MADRAPSDAPVAPGPSAAAGFDGADAAMLATVVLWALSNVYTKLALAEILPLAFIFARFAIATPALFAWTRAREPLAPPRRDEWAMFLLAGVAGYGVFNLLFITGIERTSAFAVALYLSLGPVFTLLFAALLGIERVSRVQWVGVAVAVLGVAVFVSDKIVAGGAWNLAGDLISIAASMLFAVYSLATRPLVRSRGAASATAWSVLIGFAVLLPFTVGPAMAQEWRGLSASAWAGVLLASLGSLLVAYNVWAWAITRRGVGRTAPYLFLTPVMTGVFSAILTGERFGPLKIAGALLVLLGTALVRLIGGRLAARDLRRAAAAEP